MITPSGTPSVGYPGVAISPFYEALYNAGTIEHVLVRQEQAAGHAASGYARISRKAAVCVTSSGPGATNLITALATAYADSIPLIAITGQVNSNLLGRDVFQEADMRGSTESFVKYSYLVKSADDIPRIFKEAFYIERCTLEIISPAIYAPVISATPNTSSATNAMIRQNTNAMIVWR